MVKQLVKMKHNNDHTIHSDEWDENEMTFGHEPDSHRDDLDNLTGEEEPSSDELSALQQKYDELNDSYLRLHADFDNYRKRTLKEKAEIIKNGGERVLTEILPLADDFERALISLHESEDKEAMLEGMDLIYAKFKNFLQQQGIKEIEAIGQPFDPDRFEALTTVPAPEASQKGVVLDCIQKGYELGDKIIRFPKVIVGE